MQNVIDPSLRKAQNNARICSEDLRQKGAKAELQRAHAEVQQVPALHAEMDGLRQELIRARYFNNAKLLVQSSIGDIVFVSPLDREGISFVII